MIAALPAELSTGAARIIEDIVRPVSALTFELDQTTDDYLAVFSALSEPLRVRILHMMARQPDGEIPFTLLEEELPVGKSTVSYHVGILRRAGLLRVRKAGRNYFYRLREDRLRACAPAFLEHLRTTENLEVSAA